MRDQGLLTGEHFLLGDYAAAEGAILAGCRFFAGYSGDEIAEILDCSRTTVQRDWRRAKGLLAELMT